MKSLLKGQRLAQVARQHDLATKHYKMAVEGYVTGDWFLAGKAKRIAIQHSRKAKALEHRLIPGIHFDEDARISLQSAWRFLL